MTQKLLFLNSEGKPFPSEDEPLIANSFKYAARPMGGVPIITASLKHGKCLDDEWTGDIYVMFRGERFYLKQVPTSAKNNEDARYSYDVELVSQRLLLDNVYFYDATVGEDNEADKIATNNTKFVFGGTLGDYITKLNASLKYSGLDDKFSVRFDDGYESSQDFATISIDDLFLSSAIQNIFSIFNATYRFEGGEIIIGDFSLIKTVDENGEEKDFVFKYGYDESLVSIRKITKDQKTVNRASARGGSDNLDYYYPNVTSKGDIGIEINEDSTVITDDNLTVSNQRLLASKLNVGDVVRFSWSEAEDSFDCQLYNYDSYGGNTYTEYAGIAMEFESNVLSGSVYRYYHKKRIDITTVAAQQVTFKLIDTFANVRGPNNVEPIATEVLRYDYNIKMYTDTSDNTLVGEYAFSGTPESPEDGYEIILGEVASGDYYIVVDCIYNIQCDWNLADSYPRVIFGQYYWEVVPSVIGGKGKWVIQDSGKNIYDLADCGLELTDVDETSMNGDSFTVILKEGSNLMPYQENLVPPVYRKSDGKEMFYNAINYPFAFVAGYILNKAAGEKIVDGWVHNDNYKDENGDYIVFENPYSTDNPREQIFKAEHIKVTIEGITNDSGVPIDEIYAVAYDENDNDKTVEKNEGESTSVGYEHPYFFIKLPKLPFNLFDHALESGDMTISMKTGKCASCNFTIGVDDNGRNPVQVDGSGGLKHDENGDVIYTGNPQDEQQDTKNNEVWIALQKEESTFGFIMPNREREFLVESGDNFVITNISLPNEYVYAAEERLLEEIIKYLRDNNTSTHDFEIKFSRVFLQENTDVRDSLSENSILKVGYNGKDYTLYVTSYSYNANNEALPEITVSLSDKLEISQNSLQQAIEEVKEEVSTVYCIKKDVEDTTRARVKFAKGISFEQGYNVAGNGTASLDVLSANKVTAKSASFDTLNITSFSVNNFSVQDFVASTAIISSFNNTPTFERGLRIGEILLSYDNDNKALKITSWDGSFNAAVTASGDLVAFGSLQTELPSGGVTSFAELSDVPTLTSSEKKYWGWDGSKYAWLDAPAGGGGTPDLTGYATEKWVTAQGFVTESWVTEQGYLTSANLTDYATQSWVEEKGYLTSNDLTGYVTAETLATTVKNVNDYTDGEISKLNIGLYAKTSDIQQWVTAQGYATNSELNTAISGANTTAQGYANEALADAKSYADGKFVTLNTGQEITAAKKFVSMYDFFGTDSDGIYFYNHDPKGVLIGHYTQNYYGDASYLQFRNGEWKGYVQFMTGIYGNVNVKNGGIEIFDTKPYIDFHYGNSTEDMTSRIWETASGVLELFSSEFSPGTLKIGNAYLTYDSDNNALMVSDGSGGAVNLVAMGDVAAFGGLGSGFDTLTDLTLTNSLTAKNVKATGRITAASASITGVLTVAGGLQVESGATFDVVDMYAESLIITDSDDNTDGYNGIYFDKTYQEIRAVKYSSDYKYIYIQMSDGSELKTFRISATEMPYDINNYS